MRPKKENSYQFIKGTKTLVEAFDRQKNNVKTGITFIYSGGNEKFLSYCDLYNVSLQYLFELQQSGLLPGDELIFQISDHETFLYYFYYQLLIHLGEKIKNS